MKLIIIIALELIINLNCIKFFYKRKPKLPQLSSFSIPQVPELNKYVYPSLQYHLSKHTTYNEFVPSADLASIETKVGLVNPQNLLFYTLGNAAMLKEAALTIDK